MGTCKEEGYFMMDKTTFIGILIGLIALIGGFIWEGGHISGLWEATAALIVFGGTIAAVVISFPMSRLRSLPQALRMAFREQPRDLNRLVDDLVAMSLQARREGVLALESSAQKHSHPFLRDGMMMVVDGTEPEVIQQMMDMEMDSVEQKHDGYAKIFEAAGGYAPTMGIIGTVMGLIHVLGNLSDPSMLGPSIAVAFTATLYGVVSANVIYLPIATKIKTRSALQIREMELIQLGILAIQAADNPKIVRRKLSTFMQGEDAYEALREVSEPKRGMNVEIQK